MIVTTRGPQKCGLLRRKGADECLVDEGRIREVLTNSSRHGVDAALEIVGALTLGDTIQSVKPPHSQCRHCSRSDWPNSAARSHVA